jgi:hypothetical protein
MEWYFYMSMSTSEMVSEETETVENAQLIYAKNGLYFL